MISRVASAATKNSLATRARGSAGTRRPALDRRGGVRPRPGRAGRTPDKKRRPRSRAVARAPRSHSSTGTRKPCFGRSRTSAGRTSATASLSRCLSRPPVSSLRRRSRARARRACGRGTAREPRRPTAIDIRSIRASSSSGRRDVGRGRSSSAGETAPTLLASNRVRMGCKASHELSPSSSARSAGRAAAVSASP